MGLIDRWWRTSFCSRCNRAVNPRHYRRCTHSVPAFCSQWWRNLDSGHLCWCGLLLGHSQSCVCGFCGAEATVGVLYGAGGDGSDAGGTE